MELRFLPLLEMHSASPKMLPNTCQGLGYRGWIKIYQSVQLFLSALQFRTLGIQGVHRAQSAIRNSSLRVRQRLRSQLDRRFKPRTPRLLSTQMEKRYRLLHSRRAHLWQALWLEKRDLNLSSSTRMEIPTWPLRTHIAHLQGRALRYLPLPG